MKLLLVCSSLAAASAESCVGSSCAESATMLQLSGRDKKVRTSGGSSSRRKSQANSMYESAVQLLREGATPEVVTFSTESLKQISGPVKQAILDAHTSDVKRLEDLYPEFKKVLDNYQVYKDQVANKRQANTQLSEAHKTCRNNQAKFCDDHNKCRGEQSDLWRAYLSKATAFQTTLGEGETDACGNATKEVTEHTIAPFEDHLKEIAEAGEKAVKHWTEHKVKMDACNVIQQNHKEKKASCDTAQRELEQAVCENHRLHQLSRAEVQNEWALISKSWDTLTKAVKEEEKIRKNEFTALHEVECLLGNIQERGGQPCDTQKDESGNDEADKIISQCRDETVDLGNWTITIETPPKEPEIPADRAFPCTEAFEKEHYKSLKGECHELATCHACDEVTFQSVESDSGDSSVIIPRPEATEEILPSDGEECVKGVRDTKVDFASSHTVRLQVRMPAADSVDDAHQRQWILSASKGGGAEHWLWSPTGQFGASKHGHIQFGMWGGKQIKEFQGSDETKSDILDAHSLTAVFDADAGLYKLFMNGKEMKTVEDMTFKIDESKLYIGVIPSAPEADTSGPESVFTGCIEAVQLFDRDLLASEVAAFAEEQ